MVAGVAAENPHGGAADDGLKIAEMRHVRIAFIADARWYVRPVGPGIRVVGCHVVGLVGGESYTATRGMSVMCRDSVGEIVSGRWRHDGGQRSILLAPRTDRADTAQVYSGAALSPRAVVSLVTNDAATITTVIKPSTSVQMALISGFTPSRTSE